MTEQHAVIVTKPGHDTVRLGPFPRVGSAEDFATALNLQLHCTAAPEGTHADIGPFDPVLQHLPLLYLSDWELADLLNQPEAEDAEARFPDLFSRLWAQWGSERATDQWRAACLMADQMNGVEMVGDE